MQRASPLLFAPILLALAYVLNVYVDSGEVLETLPRPMLLAALGAGIVQLLATALFQSPERGAIAAVLALTALVHPILTLLLIAAGLTVRIVSRLRGRPVALGALGMPVLLLFALSTVRVVTGPNFQLGDLVALSGGASVRSDQPDVFLVLLDAYPGADTLSKMGYDNKWFEEELTERGFDVSAAPRSNYSWTYLVLPTTFHMAHAADIASLSAPPQTRPEQRRAIRNAMSATPATARLRDAGYRIISAGLPGSSLTLRDVDEYLPDGSMTIFEHQILERMALGELTKPFVLEAYRDRTLNTLDAMNAVADDPASTFLFAHLLNPHVPFVFDRNGDIPQFSCSPDCSRYRLRADESGLSTERFDAAYVDQVHYLNGLVLASVDEILASSPGAVILLFSDHGMRATGQVTDEWYSTFFAARTPGHDALYGDEARPIEIFSRLFGAYFGDAIAIPADISFQSPYRNFLPLTIAPWPADPAAVR